MVWDPVFWGETRAAPSPERTRRQVRARDRNGRLGLDGTGPHQVVVGLVREHVRHLERGSGRDAIPVAPYSLPIPQPDTNMTIKRALPWAATALVLATAVEAQQAPRPEDVATIDGIIRAYYEVVSGPVGEVADVQRDRSLHHPEAWVAIARVDADGKPLVNVTDLAGYHGDNAPRTAGFWERETDRVVQRSGNMVHVWSSYASARTEGGEPFERGVNSITLFHDGERWWVMGWMFDSSAG